MLVESGGDGDAGALVSLDEVVMRWYVCLRKGRRVWCCGIDEIQGGVNKHTKIQILAMEW